MGKYIDDRLLVRPEPDNTFWADSTVPFVWKSACQPLLRLHAWHECVWGCLFKSWKGSRVGASNTWQDLFSLKLTEVSLLKASSIRPIICQYARRHWHFRKQSSTYFLIVPWRKIHSCWPKSLAFQASIWSWFGLTGKYHDKISESISFKPIYFLSFFYVLSLMSSRYLLNY